MLTTRKLPILTISVSPSAFIPVGLLALGIGGAALGGAGAKVVVDEVTGAEVVEDEAGGAAVVVVVVLDVVGAGAGDEVEVDAGDGDGDALFESKTIWTGRAMVAPSPLTLLLVASTDVSGLTGTSLMSLP